MNYYIINTTADQNGLNEVHKSDCFWATKVAYPANLDYFPDELSAVSYAKSIGWTNADGCWHCCPKAHHG